MGSRRGYYTTQGYKGKVENGSYMLFSTEREYEEYLDFTKHQSYFIDVNGMFGKAGELVTESTIINYWNENYAHDPVLSGYRDYNDWWKDTKRWLVET